MRWVLLAINWRISVSKNSRSVFSQFKKIEGTNITKFAIFDFKSGFQGTVGFYFMVIVSCVCCYSRFNSSYRNEDPFFDDISKVL